MNDENKYVVRIDGAMFCDGRPLWYSDVSGFAHEERHGGEMSVGPWVKPERYMATRLGKTEAEEVAMAIRRLTCDLQVVVEPWKAKVKRWAVWNRTYEKWLMGSSSTGVHLADHTDQAVVYQFESGATERANSLNRALDTDQWYVVPIEVDA